jgi:mono/diheme cytochrome c family protein/rhodanese-related sulfurtransferase
MRLLPLSFLAVALSSLGCGSPTTTPDAASEPIADAGLDAASVTIDAPLERDAPASPDASAPDAFDPSGDASVIERGRALYGTHCALCHAADATGYAADDAPAIGRDDFLVLADDAFLEIAVHDGRPGTPMSAWGDEHGGPFTREDSRHVVAFLRSLQVAPSEDLSGITVSGDATRGSVVFARECASCHGPEGEGVSAVTLDNAVFQDSVSDGFLRRSIERGRRETPMPGFAGTLTPQQIDDVVAFVRTLRREPMPEWPIEDAPTLETLVRNPAGASPSFTLIDGRYVPAADVHAALEAGQRMILLDARANSDWVIGHIPGAVPFPFYSVDELAASLPTDGTWIIAYCACPHAASGRVMDDLRARGFANTAVLDEGIYFWQDAGYPMARGRLP